MFNYYNKDKGMLVPLKAWVKDMHDMEPGCLEQAMMLTKHPKVFSHIALMPDCHVGIGMPIGGVIATESCIIPAAVGVDIGCGMAAVQTNLTDISTDDLKAIMGIIRQRIPVGFNHHKQPQKHPMFNDAPTHIDIVKKHINKAPNQLGTLGGGNHFIEIQKGDDGFIWFMIHSGSRNFGLQVAKEYIAKAKALCMKFDSKAPRDLSFLPIGTPEYTEYVDAMNYALNFAQANRDQMITEVSQAIFNTVDGNVTFNNPINIHHNYATIEHHFGRDVMIHRKGATQARKGTIGIIPGSQGTGSYIVEGLGNAQSFNSCSHGAGRKLSRSAAKKVLDLEAQQKLMDDQGIVHGIRTESDLDEAPGAYKDIDTVMANQSDLVKVVTRLTPLAVVKG